MYTAEQITRYLTRINLDEASAHHTTLAALKAAIAGDALKWLATLQTHQMASVPFENLALHYSTHHSVRLELDHLYTKIVTSRKGGYCMENNGFFATVLRSVGYDVTSVGARVSNAVTGVGEEGGFGGWYSLPMRAWMGDAGVTANTHAACVGVTW